MHPLVSQQLAEAQLSDRYRRADSRRLAQGTGAEPAAWRASLGGWLIETGLRLVAPGDRSERSVLVASQDGGKVPFAGPLR